MFELGTSVGLREVSEWEVAYEMAWERQGPILDLRFSRSVRLSENLYRPRLWERFF